jgi:hypothetical protein
MASLGTANVKQEDTCPGIFALELRQDWYGSIKCSANLASASGD